mmetsp:Transcript_53727/g.125604  ORF Transcript_53727/g.125604 Transcript_53727/m.125604 type:complete len:106 (-) Transcript_53727:54-371(-)|eukprot:CAMPEP_0177691766 /NCGR_PEP_ID=MMETSP0484_2-20121128/1489_1 /TAXON_ID=354590 /ORGANISM="Rhodomonas lens, Strain RHODO" /LENGTH=105 /DNA_ID=CAMNT_0019202427 /DNA_START=33 /DNA_END=350 /DNA_ORIENTATION=+
MPGVDSTGLAVGLKKGFLVEKRTITPRPASRKGKQGKHVKFVREIVREIAGMSPLERRAVELLKNGRDKRVLKLCKKRLGTHKRAKAKREHCSGLLRQTQRKAAK